MPVRLIDNIACIVDHIDIIAGPANKRVRTRAAIQRVIADAAGNPVGQGIACAGEVCVNRNTIV